MKGAKISVSTVPSSTTAAPRSSTTTGPTPTFAALGVPQILVDALAAGGMTTAFPIQTATLPDTLQGRDVLGRGRTGSGKTLAFALPLVARLAASRTPRNPKRPRSLVLAPTRELASQIAATVTPLATAAGLRVTTVFGGVGQNPQAKALAAGVDVLIACPGRLEDLIGQRLCDLGAVDVTVLDEADHMADLGFLPGVKRLLDSTPKGGQRMLFSATLDNGVDVLVRRYLSNPLTHAVDSAASPVTEMTHHVLAVSDVGAKSAVVRELASGTGRRLLFTRTKHGAKKLAKQLTAAGIPAVDLHGNLSQNARERNLAAFSGGEVRVLVATDIAARGIHVDDIELVVHVDPPTEHKAYLHRSGRTARAGSGGDVVTVMLPEQRSDVATLTRQAGIKPTRTTAAPGAPAVAALIGHVADHVVPAPVVPAQPARAGARAGGSGRGRTRSGSAPKAGQQRSGGQKSVAAKSGSPRSKPQTGGGRRGGTVYSTSSGGAVGMSMGGGRGRR